MATYGFNGQIDFDLAVLGGGSAGYAAARTAVAAGLRTVLIENAAEVGGLCILRGCMPTKALLHAAEVMQHARQMEPWGVRAENVGFDFTKVMANKDKFIADLAVDRRQQLAGGGFKFLRGQANFLDPHTLAFADFAGNRQYITVGNLADNPRAMLFLMDYAVRRRVKI